MLQHYLKKTEGNVVIIFALSLAMLTVSAGAALDYATALSAKTANQGALDSAVLAAAAQAKSQGDAKKLVAKYFAANGGEGSVIDVKFNGSGSAVTVSATSEFAKQNAFGGILHVSTTDILTSSTAQTSSAVTSMTVEPVSASGAWSKKMTLHNVDKAGVDTVLGSISYAFGMTSIATGTITTDIKGPITIPNPESVYFQMDIDKDPAHSWYTEYIGTGVMKTNDPETSYFMFVDGKLLPKGTAVNLATYIPCDQKVQVAWEDGGNFSGQDFFFNVTGKCTISAGTPVRLSE